MHYTMLDIMLYYSYFDLAMVEFIKDFDDKLSRQVTDEQKGF